MQRRFLLTAVAAAAMLTACGGDDHDRRGSLLEAPQTVATLSTAQVNAIGLVPLAGAARCDVRVQSLNFRTVGVNGEETNSSGVLLVPAGACANQAHPLLAYDRGTEVFKPRTLASASDSETLSLAAFFAAQGYAVVAPDYLGYAKSNYSFHPYLHADTEASTTIDAIRAARAAASSQGVNLNGRVMVAGYSQGGHASAATQRAIERDLSAEINLVAAAHLAGPYNLSGSLKLTNAVAGYQFFVPLLITAWQKTYGNVYSNVSQVFKAPYASYIENLLPSPTYTYTTLVTSGQLPAGPTPNQARDALMQEAFLADVQNNPNNGLYQAALKNDLLNWTPRARTLLCGGAGDPTVPTQVHMNVAQAGFTARGLTNVTSVDVDPQIRAAFGVNGQAPTDPTSPAFATYYGNYHGTYEPPFCMAQARALFDQFR